MLYIIILFCVFNLPDDDYWYLFLYIREKFIFKMQQVQLKVFSELHNSLFIFSLQDS